MKPHQTHALKLLDLLIADAGTGKQARGTMLLSCVNAREGYARIPEEEFCPEWVYTVGPHFADALDISLQRRKRDKKDYHVWTQGTAFAFRDGYTIHKTDGSMAVQVMAGKSATPARDGVKRDPGSVLAQTYTRADDSGAWKAAQLLSGSQDDFVRYLICGHWTGE